MRSELSTSAPEHARRAFHERAETRAEVGRIRLSSTLGGTIVPEVVLTRALAAQTGGELRHQVEAANVRGALEVVIDAHPLLRRYLLTDTGQLRPHVNVFVNDALVEDRRGLSDTIGERDQVHVLQAVSGGAPQMPSALRDPRVRAVVAAWNLIHVVLMVRVLRDIQGRDAAELRWGKWRSRVLATLNPGGPIVYLLFGRRR